MGRRAKFAVSGISDITKHLGPKAKAKDRCHKAKDKAKDRCHKAKAKAKGLRYQGQGQGQGLRITYGQRATSMCEGQN